LRWVRVETDQGLLTVQVTVPFKPPTKPPHHNQVRIVDDSGVDLPPGSTAAGEVVCRGPTLFGGYCGAAAAAAGDEGGAAAWLQPGGWFRTGDLAVRNGGGYITVVDRKKDMVGRVG